MNKGQKQTKEWIKKRVLKLKGRKFTEEHKRKISEAQKGEKGNNWKGSLASYNSIHSYIRRTFGKPNKCERCGGVFYGRKMEWANKSGEYKRERVDWLRLCAKCHREFDRKNPIICKRLHSHE